MQNALVTGIAAGIMCSTVGLFLVLKKHSLFGDALSHMAFGGVALGMYLNIYPLWTAFIISIISSIGITKLRQSTKIPPDASIAVLLSAGLATGVVLISISKGFSTDLFSLLFGSILLVTIQEMLTIGILSIAIVSIMILFFRRFMYITFNEEQAKISGLQISNLNYLLITLATITVISSIRLVGILLISSLLVLPNLTAMMFGRGFKKTAIISSGVAVFSVISGIIVSYVANLAPGGTIVLVSVAIFLATWVTKNITRWWHTTADATTTTITTVDTKC
jgi:zinc transport system permease protein